MQRILVRGIIFRKVEERNPDREYEYLLLKRTPEEGGFWQAPGGIKKTSDRSNLDAAYREVFEETGIAKKDILRTIENIYEFVIDKHYLTNKPIAPMHEFVFAFEVGRGVDVDICKNVDCEHTHFEWLSFSDTLRRMEWEESKEAFRRLKDILNGEKNKKS